MESLLQRFGRCNRRGEKSGAAEVAVFEPFPAGESRPELPYEPEHLATVRRALHQFLGDKRACEIQERQVQDLVDTSYPDSLRIALTNKLNQRASEIRANLIETFEPWGITDVSNVGQLAKEWERLFDGEEILPESFVPLAEAEESWIARTRYLVPISRRQFRRLEREGRIKWHKEMNCDVAEDVAYNHETGLEL
jgi:hypothetical protein